MRCPRDQSELSPHKKGTLDIHHCTQCNGFFVSLSQSSASQLESLLQKKYLIGDKTSTEAPLTSPSADASMKGFVYRDVHLDYCEESHSLWFDHGEYAKIFSSPNKSGSGKSKNQSASLSNSGSSDSLSSWDIIDLTSIADVSIDALEGIGDFLGDLVSGVDLF